MNIFIREMKANRKSLVIWCIGMLFLVAAGMGKYAGLTGSGQSVNELMAQMPESLRAIMGVGTFDLSKASGYYGVFFLYLLLMATVHAAMFGSNIISKEERDKTAEFLMVKPVSRTGIITSKIIAALVNIIVLNIVTLVSSILLVQKYSKGEAVSSDIAKLMVGMFILQIFYLTIGTGIAAVSKKPKAAASISTGVLLITFILSIAIDLNDKLESLKYLTPFKYFEAKNVMYGGDFGIVFIMLSIFVIALMITLTYAFYKKRDLNI